MTTTLSDLVDHLKMVEEVILLEVLDVSSEDLVDRFQDIIEEKFEVLCEEYGNEPDDN